MHNPENCPMNPPIQRPRSDLPTVLMHWGLVLALLVSVSTGWRIASMTDSSLLMRWVDILALQGNVLRWHFVSASVLTALVIAYVAFLIQLGLGGRLTFRSAALKSPDRATRWAAINKLIYWISAAMLLGAFVTGVLVYFFPGVLPTDPVVFVHKWLSWGFVLYIVLHMVAQLVMGGVRQLLKIMTPRLAYGLGATVALSAGAAAAAVAYVSDRSAQMTLHVAKVDGAPALDGSASDAQWAQAQEVVVHTSRGFNFAGTGEVAVHVKALHDGDKAYFLFRWPDATRSQKHLPVQKTESGWKIVETNYTVSDENAYYEDKFAVMVAQSPVAAGNTFQGGPKPFPDKPSPDSKLGLHATVDGSLADVWHWKGVRSGSLNQFDDNHFGPVLEPKKGRYTGGYTQDAKTAGGYEQIFSKIPDSKYVTLKYLPKDLAAVQARMQYNPDPEVSDEGNMAMAKTEVVPYTPEADAAIPVGTVLPSVVFDKPFEGDRGDVSAHAEWKDGWWTIEASRKLDTGSKFDQPIANGMFMWVAAFDHAQVRHTRHVHPLKLQLQ
jgi:cytochrome b561